MSATTRPYKNLVQLNRDEVIDYRRATWHHEFTLTDGRKARVIWVYTDQKAQFLILAYLVDGSKTVSKVAHFSERVAVTDELLAEL